MSRQRAFLVSMASTVCLLGFTLQAQRTDGEPVETMLQVGRYVEEYYARAQSIVGVETVAVFPLARDFSIDGHVRRLVYDFRVEWAPSTDGLPVASVLRELVTVDGRPPKPGDEPECLDPKALTPEPLAMFLSGRQEEFAFRQSGAGSVGGRDATIVEYRSRTRGTPVVDWVDHCATVDLPGRTRGRVWLDPATAAILRLDEGLVGLFDFPVPRDQQRFSGARSLTVERADMSIRYRPVQFEDPEETVMLPASIETLTVVRNAGTPRVRVQKNYSNYRRFVTEGRLVR